MIMGWKRGIIPRFQLLLLLVLSLLRIMKKLSSLFLLLLLTACSDGFQAVTENTSIDDSLPLNSDITATIFSGPFEGQTVINNVRDTKLQILIPVGMNSFLTPGTFTYDQLNISGRVLMDANQAKLVEINIPYSHVLRGVSLPMNSSVLPTGENLNQFFSGGSGVPSVQFPIDPSGQVIAHIYVRAPQFGVFIQSPFDVTNARQYQVNYGTTFVQIGQFSTHPHLNGLNGGMFLFISLPQ